MIYASPAGSFTAKAEGFAAGLVGTLGVRIRTTLGVDVVARTTAGIVAGTDPDFPSITQYTATLVAPAGLGFYEVVWDDGAGNIGREDLAVTPSAGVVSTGGGPPSYVTVPALKASLAMTGQTYADADMQTAVDAASRAVDWATHRRYYLDPDPTQVRYYTATSWRYLQIDDISVLTSVAVDRTGTGTWAEVWTAGTQYVAEPFNAPADFRPYERLTVRYLSTSFWPTLIQQGVKVTGQFGWAVLPEDIKAATSILASKLLRRVREAPFGVVTLGIDQAAAMRIARTDPDVYSLIQPYNRNTPLI